MKIAVIGAGPGGLVAMKYSKDEGYEYEAFEQTELIGGTWNYTDEVGLDKNGFAIRSSMYKNLRTNLAKEVMVFENFPFKENLKESYITQPQVLEYLNDYAEEMNLKKHIKFGTLVTHVEPAGNNKWDIELQNAISKKKETRRFDVVIVANGKYEVPSLPSIPGLENFTGRCIHSHHYRSTDPYKDKVVLIVGAGPSGIDISTQVNRVAKKVFLSYSPSATEFASFISQGPIQKPKVRRIERNKAYFEDDTEEEVDEIILCTGYLYSYPFLSEKCGISIDDNYVKGLYKEFLCIEFPTMMIMCVPSSVCPVPTFEIQLRSFFAILNGHFQLPSKEAMIKDAEDERKAKNCPNRLYHKKGLKGEKQYWDDLAECIGVRKVPNVVFKLHQHTILNKRDISQCYRIINDEEFEMVS